MKCKDCTVHDCTYRDKDGNTKCYYETPYWNHFRAEAAKDILCSVLNGGIASGATGFMNEKEVLFKFFLCNPDNFDGYWLCVTEDMTNPEPAKILDTDWETYDNLCEIVKIA